MIVYNDHLAVIISDISLVLDPACVLCPFLYWHSADCAIPTLNTYIHTYLLTYLFNQNVVSCVLLVDAEKELAAETT